VTLRNTLRLAGGALLAVLVVLLGPSLSGPMTAAAQDAAPDEAAAYRAFHEASQGTDTAAALAAAKAYLDKFPSGQYADAIKKWQDQARLTQLDAAIKDKRTADMITIGKEILAADPENLNVIYALAFNIRRNELLASPPVYTNADAAVELANKGIGLIDAGKTLTGVASFDKEATLGWMKQILAMNAAKAGNAAEAIKLYEQSTAHAPGDTQIAGRNLFAVVTLRQSKYGEAAKAFNALPDADKTAAEPKPEVKAAKEALNSEVDALIDAAAGFVAFGRSKGMPPATVDRVNQLLETVYKGRFPEDAGLDGLKKILAAKTPSA